MGNAGSKDRFLLPMAEGKRDMGARMVGAEYGSDLASLSTTAIKDGENYILNGQKTWCSRGAWADWIFCIVRTDPESQDIAD